MMLLSRLLLWGAFALLLAETANSDSACKPYKFDERAAKAWTSKIGEPEDCWVLKRFVLHTLCKLHPVQKGLCGAV